MNNLNNGKPPPEKFQRFPRFGGPMQRTRAAEERTRALKRANREERPKGPQFADPQFAVRQPEFPPEPKAKPPRSGKAPPRPRYLEAEFRDEQFYVERTYTIIPLPPGPNGLRRSVHVNAQVYSGYLRIHVREYIAHRNNPSRWLPGRGYAFLPLWTDPETGEKTETLARVINALQIVQEDLDDGRLTKELLDIRLGAVMPLTITQQLEQANQLGLEEEVDEVYR